MLDFRWVSIIEDLEWLGEKITPGMAWVDLQIMLGGKELELSSRYLADRWKWPRTNVQRFLSRLESKSLIKHKVGHLLGHPVGHLYSLISDTYNAPWATPWATEEKDPSFPSVSPSSFPPVPPNSISTSIPPIIPQKNNTPVRVINNSLPPEGGVLLAFDEVEKQESEKVVIDRVYKAYPTKCPVAGRPTGKSSKDKEKIKRLLKLKTEEELISIIKRYVKECTESNVYLKNFSTFLNNLPDYTEEQDDTPLFESDNAVKRSQEILRRFMEQNEKEQKQFREQNGIK